MRISTLPRYLAPSFVHSFRSDDDAHDPFLSTTTIFIHPSIHSRTTLAGYYVGAPVSRVLVCDLEIPNKI